MDPLPHVPHSLAPGSQTVCYLPWLSRSPWRSSMSAPSRGHLMRGARCVSTFLGSWLNRVAFDGQGGSTD